jgi:Protein of unknown function (DUF2933)
MNSHGKSTSQWRHRMALWLFLAIALFFLWTEHRAHFLGVLPFLLLLACPLMHLFMHHGHTDSTGDETPERKSTNDER